MYSLSLCTRSRPALHISASSAAMHCCAELQPKICWPYLVQLLLSKRQCSCRQRSRASISLVSADDLLSQTISSPLCQRGGPWAPAAARGMSPHNDSWPAALQRYLDAQRTTSVLQPQAQKLLISCHCLPVCLLYPCSTVAHTRCQSTAAARQRL